MEACAMDDVDGVTQLIKNGANPASMDFSGKDSLYYCVVNDSLRSLKKIIEMAHHLVHPEREYGKKKRNLLSIACLYSYSTPILIYLLTNPFVKFNAN